MASRGFFQGAKNASRSFSFATPKFNKCSKSTNNGNLHQNFSFAKSLRDQNPSRFSGLANAFAGNSFAPNSAKPNKFATHTARPFASAATSIKGGAASGMKTACNVGANSTPSTTTSSAKSANSISSSGVSGASTGGDSQTAGADIGEGSESRTTRTKTITETKYRNPPDKGKSQLLLFSSFSFSHAYYLSSSSNSLIGSTLSFASFHSSTLSPFPTSSSSSGPSPGQQQEQQPPLNFNENPDTPKPSHQILFLIGFLSVAGLGFVWITGAPKDELGPDESGIEGYFKRSAQAVKDWYNWVAEPTSPKLLPDVDPKSPLYRDYTLVINLNDTLVHSEWTREYGWRAAKRPGVEQFISYLSNFYEVVVFTSGHGHNCEPLITKLDPYGFITYRLYRDSTRFIENKHVKDLTHLNRDLSKVVAIDVDEDTVIPKENTIIMKPWTGDKDDRELVALIPFLETLAEFQTPDVRPILTHYKGKHIPSTFAEYQEARKREERALRRGGSSSSNVFSKIISALFGRGGITAPQNGNTPTILDQIEENQKLRREQFWKDHQSMIANYGEHVKAQQAEMERQIQELKNKKLSLWETWFEMQNVQQQQQQQQQIGGSGVAETIPVKVPSKSST